MVECWLSTSITLASEKDVTLNKILTIEESFRNVNNDDDEVISSKYSYKKKKTQKKEATIIEILMDSKIERDEKLREMTTQCNRMFPRLEGDKVTFVGSTFLRYGEKDPYFNHCIVLNGSSKLPQENTELETYDTEREVLIAWQKMIQRENPDIIIGYNIFGFDYEFMFRRAEETGVCI